MDLYLQFGHGMMEHCNVLFQKWGGGTVILSPRDLTPAQLPQFAKKVARANGLCLLDPQLYSMRTTNHHKLISHDYWPNENLTGLFAGGAALTELLKKLRKLNDDAQTDRYIVPGIFCERVNEDWFAVQELFIEKASTVMNDKKRLATLCISGESLRFEEQIEDIVTRAESWDVDGYYVVAEHPNGQYLVDDPLWLSNLLILCSGLKLQGREVVAGYSSHQMLSLATANIDAIASGIWLNVRTFTLGKFQASDDESTSRRATWYYCPQSLSEYKIPFLDLAFRAGILEQMAPDVSLNSDFASILFSGAQPSSTNYTERDGFRHYLDCLHQQCRYASRSTFRETFSAHEVLLETAEQFIRAFHRHGVRGQDRDFFNMLDVNRAALAVIEESRGFVLDRQWVTL